jgi:putative hydrolase of the HAD superfamily
MRPKFVFFDWGGTLASLSPHVGDPANVWVRVTHELGVADLTEAEVRSKTEAIDGPWQVRMYGYLGRTEEFWRDYNMAVMDVLGIQERRDEISRQINAILDDPSSQHLFPEVPEILADLQVEGYRLGVISNNNERLLRIIHHFDLDKILDPVVFTQEVGAQKPDQRVFEFALRKAGCSSSEAIHVGDSFEADYLGATRAGLRGIWVNRKGVPPPQLCNSIPDLRGVRNLLRKGSL